MRRITLFLTSTLLLLFQFSFAVDMPAGTKLKLNKLKLKKIYFEVNDETISDKIPYGCSVTFNAEGLVGFKDESGSVFLDASITVLEASGTELVKLDDLFASEEKEEGLNPNDIKESFRLILRCQTPLQLNKKYTIRFSVKDKKSGASMVVEKEFTMTLVEGAVYKENGLTSDGIFFIVKGEKQAVSKNELAVGKELVWYCTGIQGLEEKEGNVRINASIRWYDSKGNLLKQFPDLFGEADAKASDAKDLLTLYFTPPEDTEPGSKFKLEFSIRDKNNDKSLLTTFVFTVK